MVLMRKSSWTFFILLIITVALSVWVSSVKAQTATAACPLGQGFWKNTSVWPVTELTLGSQTYTQAELLILFNTPVGGDASLNLAHQLIAATLNVANGGDPVVANAVIAQANALLAAYPGKLPYNIAPSAAEGQTMVSLGGVLDSYNSGQLTVNCSLTPTPSPTPSLTPTPVGTATVTPTFTPTVTGTLTATPVVTATSTPNPNGQPITIIIEGPVQSININIITIYDIDIQLDPNDPNLQIIQIGDIVHVEGDTQDFNGTIIIIAINIVIINVDINVDTGEYWRDEGNCNNPPPPWAPAHGWHRRCDGGNGGTVIIQPGNPVVVPPGCKITGIGNNNPHIKCSKKSKKTS
jgi:hypothetical protein